MQLPLQSVWLPKHEATQKEPWLQTWPAGHWTPQPPQLLAPRGTQVLLQARKPVGHEQVPLRHVPPWQLLPHDRQFCGSVCVFVHRPLHVANPVGQPCWHIPITQVWPDAHALPQPPQFAGSDAVLMHVPLHDVWPGAHWHEPFTQLVPLPQVMPQPPQFVESDAVDVQRPLHTV